MFVSIWYGEGKPRGREGKRGRKRGGRKTGGMQLGKEGGRRVGRRDVGEKGGRRVGGRKDAGGRRQE